MPQLDNSKMNIYFSLRIFLSDTLKKWKHRAFSIYPLFLGLLLASFAVFRQEHLHQLFLHIEIESSSPGVMQVFWDLGNGFNEADSTAAAIRKRDVVKIVDFPLPEVPVYQIRFDPSNQPGMFKLKNFSLRDGAGRVWVDVIAEKRLNPSSGIGSIEGDKTLRFELLNNDPICLVGFDFESLNSVNESFRQAKRFSLLLGIFIAGIVLSYLGYILMGGWMTPLLLAFVSWQVFFPGILSPDSLDQFWQATHDHYWNWHPPVMAILLHHFMSIGFELSDVIFLQLIFGYFGVYCLFLRLFDFFARVFHISINRTFIQYAILLIYLALMSPLTPFAPFMSTFWKDVWFTIALIWIVNISLGFFLKGIEEDDLWKRIGLLCILVILMIFTLSLRHNAILLIPVYVGILFLASRGLGVFLNTGTITLMLLGSFGLNSFLFSFYDITELEPKQSVMGLELVGLLMIQPDLLDEFPYTKSQLKDHYREIFNWADYRSMKWGDNSYMKPDFVKTSENLPLKGEYIYALKSYPFKMIEVKIRNYFRLIDPMHTTEWCPRGIARNEFGFEQTLLYSEIRNRYDRASFYVFSHPVLRWISAVHLVWIGASLGLLGFAIARFVSRPCQDFLSQVILGLLAPLYSFSYLLAIPWTAFRYIYPSTLITQCVCAVLFSVLLYWGSIRLRMRNSSKLVS